MNHWIQTRITHRLIRKEDGKGMRFLLGERNDGGVFYIEMPDRGLPDDVAESVARCSLDLHLNDTLVVSSIGTFDREPVSYAGEGRFFMAESGWRPPE